ncbi:hypothetical protein SSX86_001096 [Deinandra increscens subsp. villosa]|uniref:Uncharacterized protein n=1 Tax=Deinandra increscens subsp. villosa TaxID=3103831 RepID=A0AAP0HE73_9ASTR
MQTPKTSGSTKRSSGSEVGRRISPRSESSSASGSGRSSGRVVRQLKTSGLEPDPSGSQSSSKTPKTASPKTVDRVSPRGPVTELRKNRPGRIVELETQVTQLEDALRTVKDQLIVSESWKKQAKIDAEESRNELLALSLRLEDSQKLLDRSSSNDTQNEHNDDQSASKSNLSTTPKPSLADSAELAAALLEIDQLKVKLDTTSESEATKTKQAESAETEIHNLKENMAETLSVMKEMKNQLEDCKVSESRAQAFATETLLQLETAKKNMESLSLNSDAYNAMVLELEQTRARVCSLEGMVERMKKTGQESESNMRFNEEQAIQTVELTAELKKSKEDIEELKANLMDKETELQCVVEENDDLNAKLASLIVGIHENESEQEIKGLKSKLTSLETELSEMSDENEKLKQEIEKLTSLEIELCKKSDENENLKLEIHKTKGVIEESKQDVNSLKSKLTILENEACEKSDENEKLKLEIKKINDVTKAVKTSNCELDEELRKLKLQMGQWRKAAEVATAMLCDENSDNNGRLVADRAWSMGHYSPRKKMDTGSPYSMEIDNDDDNDEGNLSKKNGNMLKRIGVLWKKPQNK